MDGSVALVTGAARGIGAATARAMVARGARVALADLRVEQGVALARELGERATFVELDVSSEEAWARAVEAVLATHGRLNVLVNNAGVFEPGRLEDTARSSFERLISVNMFGAFLGMKAVVPAMRDGDGGVIVNTASAAGLRGNPGLFAYTATKWALRGMTLTAAAELGRYGIRVNAVLPGSIDTEMVSAQATAGRQEFFQSLPVPRQGEPEDVAAAICYLASAESSYCTGAELVVDGGLTAGAGNPPRRAPT